MKCFKASKNGKKHERQRQKKHGTSQILGHRSRMGIDRTENKANCSAIIKLQQQWLISPKTKEEYNLMKENLRL